MRTTVTFDADTEAHVRRLMDERGLSFTQALNDAIRAGMSPRPPFRTSVRSLGSPRADLDQALQLAGEIEDAGLLRRMRAGQ
ncbi:antitoxin [Janibacter alkaliphilus]|uniref:Antitoxin n=1 Tax=Janibacter alkaliphilus TaxID=1069963 RepID=A0A852X5B6_9MICO|nr:antitoxin [Janibacter alkaliphilus]NYG38099.1 hypothetical protein [Janibacter alkaliphilus]